MAKDWWYYPEIYFSLYTTYKTKTRKYNLGLSLYLSKKCKCRFLCCLRINELTGSRVRALGGNYALKGGKMDHILMISICCLTGQNPEKDYEVMEFHRVQRSCYRWLDEIIYKTEMKVWAVLGRLQRKTAPNSHNYKTFWGGFFQLFVDKKINQNFSKNVLASVLKSYII